MYSDRPLIWLFVVATVVVDAVLLAAIRQHDALTGIVIGLQLGQIAVLAVWASCGPGHRLTRGAVLVLTTALLAISTEMVVGLPTGGWLTFLAIVALIAWSAGMLFGVVAKRIEKESRKPFRVPLIELFGWTIVAAILSYAIATWTTPAFGEK